MMTKPSAADFSPHLALLGTASDVGKSLLSAALGRLLRDAGWSVAPFKAQNMSNNACVAFDGGEIGRAQYLQAMACRVAPSVHHNPVLLKPASDDRSQVIVHGRARHHTRALDYFAKPTPLRDAAFDSLHRLMAQHQVVVIEGAGSCAEVNLRCREFVNFPAAHEANARVLLIADIDRGGVFAQVVGSLEVMLPEDRERVAGILINRFRGDRRLFEDGVCYLEGRTGVPVLGVVPFCYELDLDSEDAVPMSARIDPPLDADLDQVRVAVIYLPHISNFTDFDALARVDGVAVHYLYRPRDLSSYAAVILPGSKSVAADLKWLKQTGMAERLLSHHAAGGKLLGICGGFQMLGDRLIDDAAVESQERCSDGLGLLCATTHWSEEKVVRRTECRTYREGIALSGYEIHSGRTQIHGHEPLFRLLSLGDDNDEAFDGVRTETVWSTYLHGLFDDAGFRRLFLEWIAPQAELRDDGQSRHAWLDAELERFAEHVRRHIDWPCIEGWVREALSRTGASPRPDG